MSKDPLPKGQTQEGTPKQEEQKPQQISVEKILNQYPLDRDKCRDVVMLEISKSLIRIAASLEAIPQALLGINKKIEDLSRKPRHIGPG